MERTAFIISARSYRAVLFDLDGVVTKTNALHAAAWRRVFDQFLEQWASATGAFVQPFDESIDYRTYVDGVPRNDGIRRFLSSRGIHLPSGSDDDAPGVFTVAKLSQAKHEAFTELIEKAVVEVYEPAVVLARDLSTAGIKTGLVTSSKHCSIVLKRAGLSDDLFDVKIDGQDAERMGLRGKPHPDGFEAAARALEVPAACAIVIDDAMTGVRSAQLGMFGCVIGVDRTGHAEALQESGADLVVTNLHQVAVLKERELIQRPAGDLPSALRSLPLMRRLAGRKRLAIFLDYDGTLSPIVERPEDAVLSPDTRTAIQTLAARYTVAIVSGRDLDDVRRLVGIPNIFYAGSHGFEIMTPDERRVVSDEVLAYIPLLDSTERDMEAAVRDIPGAAVERKKFSVAVHYRRVPTGFQEDVRAIVDKFLLETPELRMTPGKKVFDFQPRLEWDKGKALLWMLRMLGLDGCATFPLYIGDDVTDEDAFREVQHRGAPVIVREEPRPTAATYALEDPDEVRQFLAEFAAGGPAR